MSKPLTVAAIGCAVLATATWGTVAAAGASPPEFVHRLTNERQPTGERYFIDFRSRPGHFLGHTFITYGHLNARGQPLNIQYAGMYPRDDHSGLILGSLVPVPGSVRVVKDDLNETPTNSYRRQLTAVEYARLNFAVRHLRATEHHWHLLFFNCNDFAIEIAKRLGLRAPSSWLLPTDFVAILRALNER